MNLEQIIREKQGSIVDVRTPAEFRGGHAQDSINIPLNELPQRLEELKGLAQPIVLCCASGGRSAQAHRYLAQQHINCHDAGSWLDVNYYQSQTV